MSVRILIGDVRERLRDLADESVHCVVTSPPYFGLRDYGMPGQIGLEPTPAAFVETMVEVFRDVRRVLRKDGTLWLNIGDSYAANRSYQVSQSKHQAHDFGKSNAARVPCGLKPKDLIGIPWRVAFALQADGWYLRQDIIWHKPNPMPESVTDRCTKAHEYIFLLTKSERYAYDAEAIKEAAIHEGRIVKATGSDAKNAQKGEHGRTAAGFTSKDTLVTDRNRRSVWTVATQPFSGAHFATFPPALIEPCIKAGCPIGGTVLDPFGGAGTTGLVADRLGIDAVLIEMNPEYARMAERRIRDEQPMFSTVSMEAAE
jgi:DNA modification methylase